MSKQLLRFHHSAQANHPGGHTAFGRTNDNHSTGAQRVQVSLSGGVIEHPHIHGRSDHDGTGGRQRSQGEQAVCPPGGQLGQGVGGGRGNDQQVCNVAQTHVQNMRLCSPEVLIGIGLAPGQGLEAERERADEALSRFAQHHIYF